jgi:hypothetical protein
MPLAGRSAARPTIAASHSELAQPALNSGSPPYIAFADPFPAPTAFRL